MTNSHFVAIIGGGAAGAEAANILSGHRVNSVVFEQNALPYGKIEDGLPKWHIKLRYKEEQSIDFKLNNPFVTYVPLTRLGTDVRFEDIVQHFGFSAVIIAVGAWKDRPLPIHGIDEFTGKGLYYQNSFIQWFNHCHEPEFSNRQMEAADGAIVIGGGLASLDVVKVLMIETVKHALESSGIKSDIFTLERSIASELSKHGLTLQDLGLKGCTLFYRKRISDMPLSPLPANTPEQKEKAEQVRIKILKNFRDKYLFHVAECLAPADKITDGDNLTGIVFRKTRLDGDRWVEVQNSGQAFHSPLVISSIGSVPVPIPGIPYSNYLFRMSDLSTCRIEGYDNVFTTGNAVTGRGNILESVNHARTITKYIVENHISNLPLPAPEKISAIKLLAGRHQKKAGYDGDYQRWINEHLPVRLERMVTG